MDVAQGETAVHTLAAILPVDRAVSILLIDALRVTADKVSTVRDALAIVMTAVAVPVAAAAVARTATRATPPTTTTTTTAPTAKSVLSARVAASVATSIRSRTKALSRIGRGIAAPLTYGKTAGLPA